MVVRLCKNLLHKAEQHEAVVDDENLLTAGDFLRSRGVPLACLVNFANRFHEEDLPLEIDCLRDLLGAGHLRNLPTSPVHNFIKSGDPFLARCCRVTHLAPIEINSGFLSLWPSE